MRAVTIFAAVSLLSACAPRWPSGSYADLASDQDALAIAPAISDFIANNANGQPVLLAPDAPTQGVLAIAVMRGLDLAGVRTDPGGQPASYVVAPLGSGEILRVTAGGKVGSRFYTRTSDGRLQPGGPMMVAQR